MANTIKLRRGTSTPSTSNIADGEVAIDTSAKKLYINDSGTVKEIGGGTTVGGATGVDFNDNVKTRYGTGNDLELFFDGTDSKISSSQGELNITHTGNGQIKFLRQGGNGITIDGSGWVLPSSTNTIHLGYSSYRFNKIWGNDGDFSGTCTANSFAGDGSNLTGISITYGNSSSNAVRKITTSTSTPSGGSDGDIWVKYTN